MVQLLFFLSKIYDCLYFRLSCSLSWTIPVASSVVRQPVSLTPPLPSVPLATLRVVGLNSVLDFLTGCCREGRKFYSTLLGSFGWSVN